jgi:hypothetical protein
MLRRLWDLMFTRSQWTIIAKHAMPGNGLPWGTLYVLQDQWGNIKQKVVGNGC